MCNCWVYKHWVFLSCITLCVSVHAAKPQPAQQHASAEAKSLVEKKKSMINRTALVDPTLPLGYSAKGTQRSALKLQAIFFGNNRKEAIVNGVSLKEGDSIQGKRIVKIKHDAIVIEKNGGLLTLVLRPSIFK